MLLALFDFDGTISTEDSTTLFLKYLCGKKNYYFKKYILLSPYLIFYRLNLISEEKLKVTRNKFMLQSYDYTFLLQKARTFSETILPTIIKKSAIEKLNYYRSNGAFIVIVSASIDILLLEWCQRNGFHLISNKLKVISNKIPGDFELPDCNYDEKKIRILAEIDLANYDEVHAYGDTKGDLAMMSIATKKYFKYFQ